MIRGGARRTAKGSFWFLVFSELLWVREVTRRGAENTFCPRRARRGAENIFLSTEDAEGRGEQQGRIGFSVRSLLRINRFLLAQVAVRTDGNGPQTPERVEAWRRHCRYVHLKIYASKDIFIYIYVHV